MIYLHCIAGAETEARTLLERQELPGMAAEPLFGVEAAGLIGVVSRVPAEEFGEQALNEKLSELARLAPLALRHEAAIRALMPAVPALIPLSFGAVYRETAGVAALLQERAEEFRALLARLDGRDEWELKLFLDPARLREAADRKESEQFETAIAAAGAGRAYLLRKQRARLLEAEGERMAAAAITEVLTRLEPLSDGCRCDRQLPANAAPALAFRAAFLVPRSAVDAFRDGVAEMERLHAARGLTLELSGPWAPYSFVREARA